MTAAKQKLVERVARAICIANGYNPNGFASREADWRNYVEDAQAALEACHADEMIAALNEIACWGDGDNVGGWFDEPGAAKTARAMLAKLEAKP